MLNERQQHGKGYREQDGCDNASDAKCDRKSFMTETLFAIFSE
jgi:hypothetical protein